MKPLSKRFVTNYNLLMRWPDIKLYASFREFLTVFHKLTAAHLKETGKPEKAIREGYEQLCRWIYESIIKSSESCCDVKSLQGAEKIAIRSLVMSLKDSYGHDWLQSMASLLGMLMHFSVSQKGPNLLENNRRPNKPFSSYPTSPAVVKLVADTITKNLLKHQIPGVCNRFVDAERYAKRALTFRILDPSMESGQLLLGITLSFINHIHRKHPPHSKTARYLSRAFLKRLCHNCLWGIDRNELATSAVSLIFSLLGMEFGIKQLAPTHILANNALEYIMQEKLSQFDGVVNNPPWGENLSSEDQKKLRAKFSTIKYRPDTYIAFSELAIKCLRQSGIFALILPSQVVAARNAVRLREFLLCKTEIEKMIFLPRSAFADASVRGIVLIGRAQQKRTSAFCQVTTYPLIKRFDYTGPIRSFSVSTDALRSKGGESWWSLLNLRNPSIPGSQTVRLEQVATVSPGVQMYAKGQGFPPQTAELVNNRPFTFSKPARDTIPAIKGRDVHDFSLADPKQFIKFGKQLARIGNHDSLRKSNRIFVRELCRRDGKLTAAVAKDGFIPLHGVLTVVPKMINVEVLVGILSSKIAADYVRAHTASFLKVDFQKITVTELRHMPISIEAVDAFYRPLLGFEPPTEQEIFLCEQLKSLVKCLSKSETLSYNEAQKLHSQLEEVVMSMYR